MAPPSPAVLSIRACTRWLLGVVGALVLLDLAGVAFTAITGHDYVRGLLPLTDLDEEQAPGTVFALGLMLSNALLFMVVARGAADKPKDARRWWFLGVVFLFLALDEQAALHERLISPMRDVLPDLAILHFAWVVPYGAAVLVLALWIGPFILRQRREVRRWFVLAAATFLSGALGLELVGALTRARGVEGFDPIYDLVSTTEEALELVGLIFLTVALFHLIRLDFPGKRLEVVE